MQAMISGLNGDAGVAAHGRVTPRGASNRCAPSASVRWRASANRTTPKIPLERNKRRGRRFSTSFASVAVPRATRRSSVLAAGPLSNPVYYFEEIGSSTSGVRSPVPNEDFLIDDSNLLPFSVPSTVTNFSVTMPNLCLSDVEFNKLPTSLQNGINFLRLVTFSRSVKFRDPILPPMQKKDQHKQTLVLDLDETLMHCSASPLKLGKAADFTVRFEGEKQEGYVYLRPNVYTFLEVVSKTFEIAIFTASTQPYADQVLDRLDPSKTHIRHRLYRPHCTEENGGYVKDLRQLGRELHHTVIVDNSPISLAYQLDNAVVISTWVGDAGDTELIDLLTVLQDVSRQPNVPVFLAGRYGLKTWVNSGRDSMDPL